MNSKWIIDLSAKPIKLPEKKIIGEIFCCLELGKDLLDMIPYTGSIKKRVSSLLQNCMCCTFM